MKKVIDTVDTKTAAEQLAYALDFTKTFCEHEKSHPIVREVSCMRKEYPECMVAPMEGDALVGRRVYPYLMWAPQVHYTAIGYCCDYKKVEEVLASDELNDEQKVELRQLRDFWKENDSYSKIRAAYTPEIKKWLHYEQYSYEHAIAHPLYRISGTQLDYGKLLKLGVDGLKEQIEEKKSGADDEGKILYTGMSDVLDLFSDICIHYVRTIDEILLSSDNEQWKEELAKTRTSLQNIAHNKAGSFRDAIQMTILWWYYSHSLNLSRMDTYLGDYYVADVDNGVITEDEALKLLCEMWKMLILRRREYDTRAFIGGKGRANEENADRFCLLAMEASRVVKDVVPQLSLRIYDGMNPQVLKKAYEVIGEGCTFPMLYNDDVNIPAVMKAFSLGYEDAVEYCPFGCGEYVINHRSLGTPSGIINLAKALESTINNGVDMMTGEEIGFNQGTLSDYNSFSDLTQAYEKQVEYLVKLLAIQEEIEYKVMSKEAGLLTFSILYDDCIESGKALLSGGVRYLGGTLESYGNVNTADSLTALKLLVFDNQEIEKSELLSALRANFEGYDAIRQKLLSCIKYGNDNEVADDMLLYVHNHICNTTRNSVKYTNLHSYLAVVINNDANTTLGHITPATPDGRLAGKYLANANNPQGGMDVNGITAMLNSIVKPPIIGHAGCVQNLKLSKDMFTEHLEKTQALLKTYFQKGGAQVMITVVSRNDLENAVKNPEQYQNLIVRVGGFSARFVELRADVQAELLSRTLY